MDVPSPPRSDLSIASVLLAGAVTLLGVVVMAGWVVQQPRLVQMVPGYTAMVFATALGLASLGSALIWHSRWPQRGRFGPALLAGLALVLGTATLIEYTSDARVGVSFPALHAWLDNHPGRMAPNTALTLVLGASAMLLARYGHGMWLTTALIASLAVTLMGIVGMVGYELQPELLYGWNVNIRMALHTAAGFIALGAGLCIGVYAQTPLREHLARRPDLKIGLIGGALLAGAATIAGVSAFVVLQRQTHETLTRGLQLALDDRIDLIDAAVERAITDAVVITTRPIVRESLARLRAEPDHPEALRLLRETAVSFMPYGMSAVRLYDPHGREIVGRGSLPPAALAVRLTTLDEADLVWHNGELALRVRVPIVDNDAHIGVLIAERPLPALTHLLYDVIGLGETAEMALCAEREARVRCFPTRLEPGAFEVPHHIEGKRLPISYALAGESGSVIAGDFRRHNVLAVYAPVSTLGLAAVLKVDTLELYRPVRAKFEVAAIGLVLVIVIGVALLRLAVLPLVRRTVESEHHIRRAHAELATSEERFRTLARNAPVGIFLTDTEGRCTYINEHWMALTGYTQDEALGDGWMCAIHPDDRERLGREWRDATRNRAPFTSEFRFHTPEQRDVWALAGAIPMRAADGGIAGYIGTVMDISERKRAEETIRELSLIDELTGLRNRRGFLNLTQVELMLARRMGRGLWLFYADLNGMKQINDSFGHAIGDLALQDTAAILRETFRDTDVIARLGGDEFAALSLEANLESPDPIVARLRARVDAHNAAGKRPFRLSVSVGAARFHPDKHGSIEQLMADADAAMYRIKQQVAR